MKIIGMDVSSSATGIVANWEFPLSTKGEGGEFWFRLLRDKKNEQDTQASRIVRIVDQLIQLARGADLVVLEGLATQMWGPNMILYFLFGHLIAMLYLADLKYIVVPPLTLKKFVTGSGAGPKDQVTKEIYRRWGFDAQTSHEADAFGLYQFGRCYLGISDSWTKPQLEAVEVVRYPKQRKRRRKEERPDGVELD